MKITNQFGYKILSMVVCTALALGSCEDSVNVGTPINEEPLLTALQLNGLLLDANTNKNNSIVEMTDEDYSTDVVFRLSKKPAKGVDVTIAYDAAYKDTYNALHNTDFELFPEANVKIAFDGTFVLAPDDQATPGVSVNLSAFDGMEEDKTYIVPLTASSPTEGVTFTEESKHMVLLVKDFRGMADHNKKNSITNVLYFEVNDTNPLNALEFKTADGKYFFDHVVLFAANINWDSVNKRVYLRNNENVQFLLDNNEQYLQPLRKAGMKVIISILGNHDEAGCAQLSDMGAREFARELAAYCKAYNLDGVAFDDEYSKSPDLNNPWLADRSTYAGSRLMYECKVAMPDKWVTLYNLGRMYSNTLHTIDGIDPGQYCDYAVGDYGRTASPGTGMTLAQCGGMSIELRRGSGDSSESRARKVVQDGYGYYMFFALDPSLYTNQVQRCQTACRGLYETELLYPTHYYPKNSLERKPIQ